MLARSESSTMSTLWMSPHDLKDVPPPNPALLWRQQTEGSIEALPPAPTALHVRCAPPYGTLPFSGLEEDTTVGLSHIDKELQKASEERARRAAYKAEREASRKAAEEAAGGGS